MTMEMSSLTVGENTYEIVDETARGRIDGIKVPTKTSELTNDSNFLTEHQDLSSYAKKTEIPKTPSDIGAEETGVAANKVAEHDVDTTSHNDIRLLIEGLTTRLNTLANSDDTTLDQMAEVVAYIKSNRTLIESVTTNKVNVSDIIDNLTTSVSNKPLSAKQGVELKKLIDAIKVPTKTSELTNDSGFLTQHQSLSGYAKTADHYTKTESDNKYQPKGSYLTSVPSEYITETELNAKKYLTAVPSEYVTETELTAKGYATQTSVDNLSEEIADQQTQIDGKQPKGNYLTSVPSEYVTESELTAKGYTTKAYVDSEITDVKAEMNQLTLNYAEGETVEEALEWLAENGDTTDVYILPDGFIYDYKLTEVIVEDTGSGYTNALDGVTKNINQRWSHSGKKLSSSNGYMTVTVPVTADKTVYVNLPRNAFLGNYPRIHYMDSSDNYVTTLDRTAGLAQNLSTDANGVTSWTTGYQMSTSGDASTNARLANADNITKMVIVFNIASSVKGESTSATSYSAITDADVAGVILSIDNPIEESGGTTTIKEYKWSSTGHSFVPADYDKEIANLVKVTTAHTEQILELQENGANGTTLTETEKLERIRNWDSPIYDGNIPVFQISTEKPAVPSTDKTVSAVYAKYDALMSQYPNYITKTDLGVCSDGTTHIYRYDFKELEPHHQSGMQWSEMKPKVIMVSGIHIEWGGIWALYYALEEIASNPELANLRRNAHLIVVPVINPYAISGSYNTTKGIKNYNGVEIHRNFEVGHTVVSSDNLHYGGAEPLTEVESQYLDNIFKENTDSAYFLTCHSNQRDTYWGTGFVWASSATNYMCNMGFRLGSKLSDAWHKKYGTEWEEGIARENATVTSDATTYPNAIPLVDGDYSASKAHVSNTAGTETRQATKYGIQAVNIEVCDTFWVLNSTGLSSKVTTHGAETYINFLLTALGVYDYKDKEEYYK